MSLPGYKTISLPDDRYAQLRKFADSLGGASMSAAMHELFRFAREQGRMAHGIPSIDINVLSDGVALRTNGGRPYGFSFDEIRQIAEHLRFHVEGPGKPASMTLSQPHCGTALVRHWRGGTIQFSVPANSEGRNLPKDLALELSDLLHAAADKGERQSE